MLKGKKRSKIFFFFFFFFPFKINYKKFNHAKRRGKKLSEKVILVHTCAMGHLQPSSCPVDNHTGRE